MKTILVDAINGLVTEEGVFEEMQQLLDTYPNQKIVVTGANDEVMEKYGFDAIPYEVFTLRQNPPKNSPEYFRILLAQFNLAPDEAVYFEHNEGAADSARSVGIETYLYDHTQKDLTALRAWLDENV